MHKFGFDWAKLFVPAITCTNADRLWLISLPEVIGDDLGSVTLKLAAEQQEIYSLDAQNVVTITDAGLKFFMNEGQCSNA